MRTPLALGRALRAKFLSTLSISRRCHPKLRRATRPVVDELEKRVMLTALPAFVHTSGNVVVGCNLQGDGSMLIDFWGGTASFDQNITAGGADFAHTRIEVHDDAQVLFNAPQTLASIELSETAKVTDSPGDLEGAPYGPHQTWSSQFDQEWSAFFEAERKGGIVYSQEQIIDKMLTMRGSGRYRSR